MTAEEAIAHQSNQERQPCQQYKRRRIEIGVVVEVRKAQPSFKTNLHVAEEEVVTLRTIGMSMTLDLTRIWIPCRNLAAVRPSLYPVIRTT